MIQTRTNPTEILDDLLSKLTRASDRDIVVRAYEFASAAHEGQVRRSGEEYICHPLEVACIIADMALDSETIAAGILHDVVEDTGATHEEVKNLFNEDIANMVEGVTKLGKIKFTNQEEEQIENLRKMFIATAKDVRVMLIKLSDRLHNMRTMDAQPDEKRRKKSLETIEIFAPIAQRLGMFRIKVELEDLSLKYLDPIAYAEIDQMVKEKESQNHDYIDTIKKELEEKLEEIHIKGDVMGRVKHHYSIFRKTFAQGREFDEIYDIFALRVIVNTVAECYAVLGAIHDMYKPIPGRIKDYIAMPKPNMYQSLHTTVVGKNGTPFEIQIRTHEMHHVAEYGIAAHWKYKQGISKSSIESKLAWIRQIMELQDTLTDDEEFMKALKTDMFADQVFVFTPKGDVIALPAGACPIDFAYSIHSAIGAKMMGAKVNGKLVPLDYTLQNGDIVDILTSKSVHGPSRDWLKIVKTSSARSKINQWFKKERREENIQHGKELIDKEVKKSGYTHAQLFDEATLEQVMRKHNFSNMDDLYSAVGYGGITAAKIINKLREEYRKRVKEDAVEPQTTGEQKTAKYTTSSNGVIVKGIDNCLVRLSRCCNPVPGDDIVGYITRGRGVSVHRKDCANVQKNVIGDGESDRLIPVEWETQSTGSYMAELYLLADDRATLLADITATISLLKLYTHSLNARMDKDHLSHVTLMVEVQNSGQLDTLISKLMSIKGVMKVVRNKQ